MTALPAAPRIVGRVAVSVLALLCFNPLYSQREEDYLAWTHTEAVAIGKKMEGKGRAKGGGARWLKTERAFSYKLRATWLTPEVIRATARLVQARDGLSDDETRELVVEAEDVGDTVIMVEIDPDEGSGVIPLDWRALLHQRGMRPGSRESVKGENRPNLRHVRALAGVSRRNYDYDRFWVVFPLRTEEGTPLFPPGSVEAELLVGIHSEEGRVRWRVPTSIIERSNTPTPRD
ncbi:MAG: hypothetical protein ACREA0_32165 [bacterium]